MPATVCRLWTGRGAKLHGAYAGQISRFRNMRIGIGIRAVTCAGVTREYRRNPVERTRVTAPAGLIYNFAPPW